MKQIDCDMADNGTLRLLSLTVRRSCDHVSDRCWDWTRDDKRIDVPKSQKTRWLNSRSGYDAWKFSLVWRICLVPIH